MGLNLGSVEFYAGPTVLGGPDDLDAVVRTFIGGAKKRLLIAVQELDSRAIAEAILAAKVAKVRVQIILEGDYLVEDPPTADPWAEVGANEDNRAIHSAVLRA
ncbi:MAG TPA: phospholipase, partial [Acidimicrobiia bacterium]|nr:phospholipase [Acidimicrobiia bacterium]